ncbi:MAG TPA: PEP-utilizing enzyme, partial [Chthoniobacterales bacterium]
IHSTEPSPTERAERRAAEKLKKHPIRRLIFQQILRQARERVRDRENLRFERTRVFGQVRRIFVEIGRRLYAMDVLPEPRDVFYLAAEESLGFIEGASLTQDLGRLAGLRKKEFAGHRERPMADRFETRGAVYAGNSFASRLAPAPPPDGDHVNGIGCCPGIVRGKVRVILDPRNALIHPGEILVAPRTDPGWIMLFPAAAGLLVEHGSLLSHSAIVAREMRIPAVVSISGITSWLKTGDEVELDGSSGRVTRIRSSGGNADGK